MRILDLQRRLREVGRIRIGEQVDATKANGDPTTRPVKLETFRLTSRDRQVIEAAAKLYGGEVGPWNEQWEVKTSTDQVPVVIPPSDMAFSQAYEQWTAAGCKARCDGQFDHVGDKECHCDPENRACKIHTRLSVILPDLPGLGVWRLDTLGFYAATELGGAVDLCASYSAQGRMLPARLRLEQRSAQRFDRDGKPITLKFVVPVLDVDVEPLMLAGPSAPMLTPVPANSAAVPSVAMQLEEVNVAKPKATRANAQAALPAAKVKPRKAAEVRQGPPVCVLCDLPIVGPAAKCEGGHKHADGCDAGSSASAQEATA